MENNPFETKEQKLIATFFVNDRCFGIDSNFVLEVVRLSEVTPVHRSPEYVLGVMNLRGRIVTIIDLGIKLGFEKLQISNSSRIFIVSQEQEFVGLLIDQVADVVPLETELLRPLPESVAKNQIQFFSGVFQAGDLFVTLLNLDVVLSETGKSL
ncbi:MAG: chemotaxis protein CheW [Candidatus Riflebacteria bacterium]|nr:chemotaxis protein CheW [Candidatus Riflebacteria bacterium]